MCTTFAKKIAGKWYLGKTRDPVSWMRWDDEIKLYPRKSAEAERSTSGEKKPWDQVSKYLIQNPDPHEDGYYGGINEYGVSFTATYIPVSEVGISYIRKPYVRLILEARSAVEAVEIIKKFNPKIGGNIFVADLEQCFGIEAAIQEYFIEEISEKQQFQAVKTNHFLTLPYPNLGHLKDPFEKKWSETHYHRASELLTTANSLTALKNILRDRSNSEQKMAICTTSAEEECFTHSAFICEPSKKAIHYCQGNPQENQFQEYRF